MTEEDGDWETMLIHSGLASCYIFHYLVLSSSRLIGLTLTQGLGARSESWRRDDANTQWTSTKCSGKDHDLWCTLYVTFNFSSQIFCSDNWYIEETLLCRVCSVRCPVHFNIFWRNIFSVSLICTFFCSHRQIFCEINPMNKLSARKWANFPGTEKNKLAFFLDKKVRIFVIFVYIVLTPSLLQLAICSFVQ